MGKFLHAVKPTTLTPVASTPTPSSTAPWRFIRLRFCRFIHAVFLNFEGVLFHCKCLKLPLWFNKISSHLSLTQIFAGRVNYSNRLHCEDGLKELNRGFGCRNCDKNFELFLLGVELDVYFLAFQADQRLHTRTHHVHTQLLQRQSLDVQFEDIRRRLLLNHPHKERQTPIIKLPVDAVWICFNLILFLLWRES